MFNHRFLGSELGQAALVSVAAMVAFVIFAALTPASAAADTGSAFVTAVALA